MKRLTTESNTGDIRGVSEIIGYTILFGIFLIAVSTVTIVGFNQLTEVADVRGWEQTTSRLVEYQQILNSVDTSSESAAYVSIPVTADRVTLQPTRLNVTLTNTSGESKIVPLSQRVLSATDETDAVDQTVGVEAGFLLDSESLRKYEQPTYQCGAEVMTLFRIESDLSNTSVQGRGDTTPARTTDLTATTNTETVQLYIQRVQTDIYPNITTTKIQLNNSAFDTAWDRLTRVSQWQRTDNALRCNETPTDIKIITVRIEIE